MGSICLVGMSTMQCAAAQPAQCLAKVRAFEFNGDTAAATQTLDQALMSADANHDEHSKVVLLLERAHMQAAYGQLADARTSISNARDAAKSASDPSLDARVAIAHLSLALSNPDDGSATQAFDEGIAAGARIENSVERSALLSELNAAAADLVDVGGLRERAAQILDSARKVQLAADARELARAELIQARLYESAGQVGDAAKFARVAAIGAQRIQDPETTFRAMLILSRTAAAQGDATAALRDARLAVEAFDHVRGEIAERYRADPNAYRAQVGAAYLQLVSLLLQDGAGSQDAAQQQRLRGEAIAVMERYRTGELRDYLLNACIDASAASVQDILHMMDAGVAVVYPIVLPDRVEVLLITRDAIAQHPVKISVGALASQMRLLRQAFEARNNPGYQEQAQAAYAMLIEPFAATLTGKNELVYVPDSWLRLVPLAALWSGNEYVLDKFAVVTAPYLRGMSGDTNVPLSHAALIGGISDAVQGYPALPGVARELDGVGAHLGPATASATLRNDKFTTAALGQSLHHGDLSVIHLATHGEFSNRSSQSYLLTYDGRFTLSELGQALQAQGGGLDLMALSACQTAAGDDRSALGLAGIAVRSGAKHTLATLWYVSDAAATAIVTDFYDRIAHGDNPAHALQQAQLVLRRSERYAHPDYWSPFVMIGKVPVAARDRVASLSH